MAVDLTSFLASRFKQMMGAAPAPQLGTKTATVIAVAASKGGVGKTTTAVNLGAGLARYGSRRVLVVDLDPQGHVGSSLGIRGGSAAKQLSAVMAERQREVLDAAIPTRVCGLDITAPDKSLTESEQLLSARIGKEFVLQQALHVTRTHYDCIVLDCPPSLGNLTVNALVAADYLLVPCEYSLLSFQGVADLIDAVQLVRERLRAAVEILGILVTQLDSRTKGLNREVESMLEAHYGPALLDTRIGVNTAIARAQFAGESIYDFAPDSRGSTDYRALVDEVGLRLRERGRMGW
ncbi:MAG: ParA family protein [Candidatus Schekmanbacteria bacterium]|nr:ParA family protein [Candidatus Schekmanbacteria bacterium]